MNKTEAKVERLLAPLKETEAVREIKANLISEFSDEYNGYTNYETWNVMLHINNDQDTQAYWEEHTRDFLDTDDKELTVVFADQIKEWFIDDMPDLTDLLTIGFYGGMYNDLLGSALGTVNWYEIAEHLIESVTETQQNEV